jgi:hypothetical protein
MSKGIYHNSDGSVWNPNQVNSDAKVISQILKNSGTTNFDIMDDYPNNVVFLPEKLSVLTIYQDKNKIGWDIAIVKLVECVFGVSSMYDMENEFFETGGKLVNTISYKTTEERNLDLPNIVAKL